MVVTACTEGRPLIYANSLKWKVCRPNNRTIDYGAVVMAYLLVQVVAQFDAQTINNRGNLLGFFPMLKTYGVRAWSASFAGFVRGSAQCEWVIMIAIGLQATIELFCAAIAVFTCAFRNNNYSLPSVCSTLGAHVLAFIMRVCARKMRAEMHEHTQLTASQPRSMSCTFRHFGTRVSSPIAMCTE